MTSSEGSAGPAPPCKASSLSVSLSLSRTRSALRCSFHHLACLVVLQKKGDKVVVAGATGGVGQLCVHKLLDKGFQVRVLTRDKDKAVALFEGKKVEVCEVDLRDKQNVEAKAVFDGCAGAVVAVGTTAFPTSRYRCYTSN
jgi:glutamyl-tRNA reductase